MGGSAGALREAVWTSHDRESRGHGDGVCSLYHPPEDPFYSWHTAVRDHLPLSGRTTVEDEQRFLMIPSPRLILSGPLLFHNNTHSICNRTQ